KLWCIAEIFPAFPAEFANSAGLSEPWNADTISWSKSFRVSSNRSYATNNFMTGNQRKFCVAQFSVDDVEIRPADGAGVHADQNLSLGGQWIWNFSFLQQALYFSQYHGAHGHSVFPFRHSPSANS